MKFLYLLIAVSVTSLLPAQESLNNYKYVIVQQQYDFQSEPDQYDLNELIIFLLKKSDLKAYKSNRMMPADINIGVCNTLSLRVNESGFLAVKTELQFVDCNNNIVYTTKEGRSISKDYRKGYHEAIRDALSAFENYKYGYNNALAVIPQSENKTVVKDTIPEPIVETVEMPESMGSTPLNVDDLNVFTFMDKRLKWRLKPAANGNFTLYEYGTEIGALRKLGNGSFIVNATEFNGVAYPENDTVVIEYESGGSLQKVVLLPNNM